MVRQMIGPTSITRLQAEELQQILEVTRKLAAPFDLQTMLSEVVDSARTVLQADRGSVFLYDAEADQLELTVATGMDPIRLPADQGIVGECVRTRAIINVPTAMPILASIRILTRRAATAPAAC